MCITLKLVIIILIIIISNSYGIHTILNLNILYKKMKQNFDTRLEKSWFVVNKKKIIEELDLSYRFISGTIVLINFGRLKIWK